MLKAGKQRKRGPVAKREVGEDKTPSDLEADTTGPPEATLPREADGPGATAYGPGNDHQTVTVSVCVCVGEA